MFTSKFNTMTGNLDWEIQNEDYDYQQELARAGFADMLHDYERNRLYYEGLKKVIKKLKSENKVVNVLDIGTGTGLLSMMAVMCGADTVTACEGFKPMVAVAKKCIEANGMKDKIKIIEKRSTEVVVGVDMDRRANVLVTEVFDTELIGEGAISTFTHALDNLLVQDCYVIPDNGVMYIQIVDSPQCHDWNWLNLEKYNLKVPHDYRNLAGDAIFDIQLTEFNEFTPLTEPLEAFRFSFSGKKPLPFENKNVIEAVSKTDGKAHGIFMWWILRMDYENEILLSCAPKWAHHTPNNMQWRDHWMQAIYFPTQIKEFSKDEKFLIECEHDEYSLKFDVFRYSEKEYVLNSDRPIGDISLGMTLVSRNRLSQLNDHKRNDMFLNLLKKHENDCRSLLIVNDDFSLLPLLAASETKYKHITILESNKFRERCLLSFLNENNLLDERITIIDKNFNELNSNDLKNNDFDLILSESSFNSILLPWDNLYLYYGLENLRSIKQKEFEQVKRILPVRLRLKAILINMENLDKIRSQVGVCEGFDLSEFDKIILDASKNSDGFMEPHPLWEYPSYPLSEVYEIFCFNFASSANEPVLKTFKFELKSNGFLNGAALWHELDFDENDPSLVINTGLLEKPQNDKYLVWSKNYKQAVHIMDRKVNITEENKNSMYVICTVKFDPKLGNFNVDFRIEEN
ncbi:unnamed protein product [Brachionus calyciflorus]|uniref:Protein arginine N-methyltransferase n=1 Tax=Brachionus calyciflorus TaxID=104777 RepID=A0A813MVS4_9BILA|nr:unnamed protein product [Brachionus calyciflorus]